MLTTILVPLDGSELAARAVPLASRIARAAGAQLLLVRATVDFDDSMVSRAELWKATHARERIDQIVAADELAGIAKQIRESGLTVSTFVRPGPAADIILEAANAHRAGLIVMSTHGRGGLGRWLYGSVADQVLRHTTVPVLLVPAAREAAWPEDRPVRVLLALDGSPLALKALGPTTEIAGALGAEATLLRVVDEAPLRTRVHAPRVAEADLRAEVADAQAYLEAAAEGLGTETRVVTIHVAIGDPASGIAATARRLNVDLIAIATHGRGGLARLVMGSVATETLRQATVPVLLVRPSNLVNAGGDLSDHDQAPVDQRR